MTTYEWDDAKARSNEAKHGVPFEEAQTVLKKKAIIEDDDEMPAEVDLSRSIPNPWFVAVHGPKYVRVIDQDLADAFPDNASMNAALRTVAEAAARVRLPRKVSARRVAAPRKKT